jgi:hypothetical protein
LRQQILVGWRQLQRPKSFARQHHLYFGNAHARLMQFIAHQFRLHAAAVAELNNHGRSFWRIKHWKHAKQQRLLK